MHQSPLHMILHGRYLLVPVFCVGLAVKIAGLHAQILFVAHFVLRLIN